MPGMQDKVDGPLAAWQANRHDVRARNLEEACGIRKDRGRQTERIVVHCDAGEAALFQAAARFRYQYPFRKIFCAFASEISHC